MPNDIPGILGDNVPRRIEGRRGFSVSYRGKTLLSTIDPIAQAERAADAVPLLNRTLYFCPSPLYGYGLQNFLGKLQAIQADSAVLCIETDEKLMDFSLEQMDAALLQNSRLRFCGLRESAALCGFVRDAWGSRRFRRVEMLRLGGAWRLEAELYEALADALRRDIALDWGNAMTLVKLGRRYIRNGLRNLALLPRSPSLSCLSFGGSPVLVLGAGPSLDKTLDGLGAAFGASSGESGTGLGDPAGRPFKIICVDTALSALKGRNIKPDLVVALESQHWNLRDFIGGGDWEIPVAMDFSALPATAEILGGQSLLFFTPWTSLSLFDRLKEAGLLPESFLPLGSVGLTAVAIALRIGSGPVITSGIDFSFTLDAYHARSTPGHLERLRGQNRLRGILNIEAAFRPAAFGVQSKSGVPVRSDPAMRGYRDLFEREFGAGSSGNAGSVGDSAGAARLRDISGSGLPLGIETVSLEQALALLNEGCPSPPGIEPLPPSLPFTSPSVPLAPPSIPLAPPSQDAGVQQKTDKLQNFIRREQEAILTLRGILKGEIPAEAAETEYLLDTCDYLWAHFPDCAGTGGRRPPGTDLSFLKRVRTEIDPFLKLWSLALKETES
ncbi:hypothetical protein AGMMS50268_39410 [Spirochaetia bacterium]|nr:hypothetical protein AGMMS50268_39410 [Spirochaetia bacterium]